MLSDKYCELLLKIGINIKKDDNILIKCPVNNYKFGQLLMKKAYNLGANKVIVDFYDETINAIKINDENIESLVDIDYYMIEYDKMLANHKFKVVTLVSPEFSNIDINNQKQIKYNKAVRSKLTYHRALTNSDQLAWCIAALPNEKWANKVFANTTQASQLLMQYFSCVLRLEEDNFLDVWHEQKNKLQSISNKLNKYNFKKLHIKTKLGTEVEIGIAKNHIWKSAGSGFVSNLPTEEVYTMPHSENVNGKICASKPLVYNDIIFENLQLEFERGRLVRINGDKNGTLNSIVKNNKGADRLGEIALVEKTSLINSQNTIMYNTLFDENAGAHIALGNAFTANNRDNHVNDLVRNGMNISDIHIDIIFGTDDLNVIGVEKNGNEVEVMKNGQYTI